MKKKYFLLLSDPIYLPALICDHLSVSGLYTQRGRSAVILLAGGEKRTQDKDIKTALRLAKNRETLVQDICHQHFYGRQLSISRNHVNLNVTSVKGNLTWFKKRTQKLSWGGERICLKMEALNEIVL